MKFISERNVLLKEVSIAQEIISVKNAMSILSNVLLEVHDGFLTIKATDLKVAFETRIPVSASVNGITTVFCEKLLGILRSLPDREIEFEVRDGKLTIKPVGTSIDFQLKSISSDKFPEIRDGDNLTWFALPQADVLEMIGQTIFSVSDDETRYYMNGVYLERKEDTVVMVATDGRRLSYIEKKVENVPEFAGIIIPPKALNLIKKLASGQGTMNLAISDKQLYVQFDNQKIHSNLIEGQFPNYSRVIPESQSFTIGLKKDEFIEALKRVSLLAEQKAKRIYLTVSEGNLMVNTEESEMGMAKEEIACEYQGPLTTMALNYVFLTDPLRVLAGDRITLEFTDPKKAMTLRTDPRKDYFHIVMPMQMD
jgi:DNA polymerase-3 subunit beta